MSNVDMKICKICTFNDNCTHLILVTNPALIDSDAATS
jgi:hypothetical protein